MTTTKPTFTDRQKTRIRLLIDALRSGEYTQTTGCLKSGDTHCVLGVAADVYRRVARKGKWVPHGGGPRSQFVDPFGRHSSYCPTDTVQRWFGFEQKTDRDQDYTLTALLMDFNDEGLLTFDQIAAKLEEMIR